MAVGTRMQQRRGLEAQWVTTNYVLAAGELGLSLDTGVVKFGDGVNGWVDLPVALDDYFLPKLGTAANSSLLEGISSSGFLKTADADTTATANKVAKRDGTGRLKAVAGTTGTELLNFDQIPSIRAEQISRSVTAAITLAVADAGSLVLLNHASTTAYVAVTVPTNASVAIPIGSWIDVCVTGAGGVKLSPQSGVSLSGAAYIHAPFGVVRLLKTGTDFWLAINIGGRTKLPQIRVYKNAGATSYANSADTAIPWTTVDTANTYNPDSEWFTIPATGLPTARRIVVNKDGLYTIIVNTSLTGREQCWIKVNKMTADNVIGAELGVGPTFWNGQAIYHGRLTAGDSIGGVFYNGKSSGAMTDEADGASGHRHDLVIVRNAE